MYSGHVNKELCVESCFSSDGKYVCSGSEDGKVWTWDTQSAQPAQIGEGILHFSFIHFLLVIIKYFYLTRLLKWTQDNSMVIIPPSYPKYFIIIIFLLLSFSFAGHTDAVVTIDAHPTSSLLVSGAGNNDKTARLWAL